MSERFIDKCRGNPEKLMACVRGGNWNEGALLNLLTCSARAKCYIDCANAKAECDKILADAEEELSKTLDAAMLECVNKASVKDGNFSDLLKECAKVCVDATAKTSEVRATASAKYNKFLTNVWLQIFENPENRIEAWKKPL